MPPTSRLLDDQVAEKAKLHLRKIGKAASISRKLQAVILARKHGITLIAKIYNVTRTTLTSWIKHVRNDTIERLGALRKKQLNNELRKADSQLSHKNSKCF